MIETLRRLSRDPLVRLFGVVELLVLAPYFLPSIGAQSLEIYADLYAMIPTKLAVILVLLVRPWRGRRAAERHFWLLFAGGYGCWVISDVVAFALPIAWFRDPRAGMFTDTLLVGFYVLVALALERRPHEQARRDGVSHLRSYRSAGAIIFGAGLAVYFAVIPREFAPQTFIHLYPSLLLFVILDVYVLTRAISMRAQCRDRSWRQVYGWMIVTAALWTVFDVVEGLFYAEVLPFVPMGTLLDLWWHLPYVAVVVAARIYEPAQQRQGSLSRPSRMPLRAWGSPLILYAVAFPLIHFVVMFAGVADPLTQQSRELVVIFTVLVLTAIALFYQRRLEAEQRNLTAAHRAARESLQVSQRMEAVGRLAGGIAHDFNNLLQVVRANAEIARGSIEPDAPEQRELEAIGTAVDRAAALTERLLTVGRRTTSHPQSLDLNDVVRETAEMLRRTLGDTIEMRVDLDPRIAPILADRGEIEQVVMNLGVNARDAMPQGGTLEIRTAAGATGDAPGEATLIVRDDGHGMDEATRAHVFEPFFTTKQPGQGTGLGLSIIYGIVTRADGRIEVTSEVDAGATFSIHFPALEHAAELRPPLRSSDKKVRGGPEAILLVEDEPGVRKLVARQLELMGYAVTAASGGREALTEFDRQQFDLVLSDVMMPEMQGPELARLIRERQPGIPVLLMSGYAGGSSEFDPDLPVVLRKPFTRRELDVQIRKALRDRATA